MTQILDLRLNILLVEDSDYKSQKVKEFIETIIPNVKINIATNQIDAQTYLAKNKYDLLLLDMLLPIRQGGVPEKKGGENLLEELNSTDDLKQPIKTIALTQYKELQDSVRNNFPELGAIQFDASSTKWQNSLLRIISNITKSKNDYKKIIYCEEKNDKLYDLLGFTNLEFRGLKGGSRKVYEAVKFEKDKFGIRDKDYLTPKEISWLTKTHFNNYFILDYYCFENYLYHPDNVEEFCQNNNIDFSKKEYIDEIIQQKEANLFNIVQDYKSARNSYFDFTDNAKKNMYKDSEKIIIEALRSKEIEDFYPYFDMKGTSKNKGFDKGCLEKYNLEQKKLVATNWFQGKMKKIFDRIL
jgi:CheY-like chemotaxis protein